MNGEDKLITCRHRSKGTYTRPIKLCCNRIEDVTAYDCPKREIFPLGTSHCEECQDYEPNE